MSLLDYGLGGTPDFVSAAQIVAVNANRLLVSTSFGFHQCQAMNVQLIRFQIQRANRQAKIAH